MNNSIEDMLTCSLMAETRKLNEMTALADELAAALDLAYEILTHPGWASKEQLMSMKAALARYREQRGTGAKVVDATPPARGPGQAAKGGKR